jgi:DNA mismatch repair protein MutS
MYEEYIKQWKRYSDQYGQNTALFLMVGKFYELYDIVSKETGEGQTNVRQAVDTLGITLTTKKGDGPKGEDCLFAGFPEQSLQKFAGILTREGWTVVVCDQQKDQNGKVQGRPVARIFSPGTHIETAGTDAPYLAGIWLEEAKDLQESPSFSIAVLDMTTGEVVSYEGKTQGQAEIWSADDVVHFFQIHPPRETIVWWRGAPFQCPTESIVRRRMGIQRGTLHFEMATVEKQGTFENAFVRKGFLQRIFSKQLCLLPILTQLMLEKKSLTERLLVCLLSFAEEHLPSAVQNLANHTIWHPEKTVYMGNNTLLQLNFLSQGQETSILSLFQKTITSLGRRGMRERLLLPRTEKDIIEKRLQEVDFLVSADAKLVKGLETNLRLIYDIARLHRKIVMNTVQAADILALEQSYNSISHLASFLEGTVLDWTLEERARFQDYKTRFLEYFDIEKARQNLENPDISFLPSSKAPKTAEAEKKLAEVRKVAGDSMETVRIWAGLAEDHLRLESQDSMSYVITGKKVVLGQVKKKLEEVPVEKHPFPGMILQMKKTVSSTLEFPALEKLHFQVLRYRAELSSAIRQELPDICTAIQSLVWSTLERWVSHIDVSLALAKIAKERGYVRPILLENTKSGSLDIEGLRHPLLESIQTRVQYVRHNVSLGEEDASSSKGWLLYGMNASGKSSLMKSIGICVLLAQAGSYVPATSCRIRPFTSILTRILNQDNLWAGLSSFAVEVSELRDIFERANEKSLVLGDELCSGTESISATSLVAAGIEYLHKKSSRFIFATHLHGLLSIPEIASLPQLGIWHLRVHYDPVRDMLIYDRTLHKGPGGTLYGLEVAKAMHLSSDILTSAHRFRKQLLGEVEEKEAKGSQWNTEIKRKECEVCHSTFVRDLEVHHIQQRADANAKGRFADGSSMNDIRNLVVVCQKCHDDHHNGSLIIGTVQQTSQGPERKIERVEETDSESSKEKKKHTKWTEEQLKTIETYLRKCTKSPLKRIEYDLREKEGIDISSTSLQKIRNTLH